MKVFDSPAVRALLGLALGLVVGVFIAWSGAPAGLAFASIVEPVGTLWVNALRMTVVPLVISLIISTLASSAGAAMFGQLGRRALLVFLAFLVGMAIVGLVTAIPIYSRLTVDPAAAASLRATAAASMPATKPPGFAAWFTSLVPANVVQSASDGAMLPLIIFAIIFGLALGRVQDSQRDALTGFFRAIAGAMMAIVQWVLLLAPIGAFALAVTVATHLGNATAHVILFYLVSHCALLALLAVMIYLIVPAITRTPIRRFARALLPAQVVAVTTRSSLAALPVMLDKAVTVLGVPPAVASFVLPLGVSLLRAQTGLSYVVYALFLGKLYGIPLGVSQLVFVAAVGIAMSFSVPGIPSGGLLIATPYFQAIGLPAQGIGILIALDAIPDIFKTLVIVQSHMSTTLIIARAETPVGPSAG
jgi:proton glutamate symport protein